MKGLIHCSLFVAFLLAFSASAEIENKSLEKVVATFDGGNVTALDLEAWAVQYYAKTARRTPQEARAKAEQEAGGREGLIEKLASARILSHAAEAEGITLNATEEHQLEIDSERLLGGLYFTRLVQPGIEEAYQAYRQRCRAYYDEHPDEFLQPAEWSFRFILVGLPVDSEEARRRKEERAEEPSLLSAEEREVFHSRALKVYELCKEGGDFLELARRHSVNAEERRGELLGPTSVKGQPPAIAAALQRLATGEVSPPVETPFGFLILRCETFSPEGRLAFKKALPEIGSKTGRFSPARAINRVSNRLKKQYPFEVHEKALSEESDCADALVVEGTAARIYNRDIFHPAMRRLMKREEKDSQRILYAARLMYWVRLYSHLAKNEGMDQEAAPSRALQLAREQALSDAGLAYLKAGNALGGLPPFQASRQAYEKEILERFHFQHTNR